MTIIIRISSSIGNYSHEMTSHVVEEVNLKPRVHLASKKEMRLFETLVARIGFWCNAWKQIF